MKSDKLREFRQAAYERLGKAHDATFELTDAILTTRSVYSLADLSLSPFFRRKWPSIYEALQDSRPNRQKLMQLYIKQIPTVARPLLAGDHTRMASSRRSNPSRKNSTRIPAHKYQEISQLVSGRAIAPLLGYQRIPGVGHCL